MPEYTFTVNGKKYTAKSDKPLSDAELTKLVASMSGSAFAGAKASAKAGSDREFVNQLQSGKWLPASASSKEAHARRGTRPPATVEDTKRESEAFTEPIKNFAIEALGQIQPMSRLGPGKKGIGGQVGTVLGSLVADPLDALIFDSQIASNPNATFWEKAGAYTNLATKVALPGGASAADEIIRPVVGAISKAKPVSKGLEAMANALGRRKPSFTTAPTTAPSGGLGTGTTTSRQPGTTTVPQGQGISSRTGDLPVLLSGDKPAIFYHGTNDAFGGMISNVKGVRTGRKYGEGIYLTTSPLEASNFSRPGMTNSRVFPVKLAVKKPFEFEKEIFEADEYIKLSDGSPMPQTRYITLEEAVRTKFGREYVEFESVKGSGAETANAFLRSKGYDSIISSHAPYRGKIDKEVVVFNNSDIIPALGDAGKGQANPSKSIMDNMLAGEKEPLEFGQGVIDKSTLSERIDVPDSVVDAFEAELPNLPKKKREMFIEITGEIGSSLRHSIHTMASNPQKLKQIVDEFGKGKDKASKEITQLAKRLLMELDVVKPTAAEQMKGWKLTLKEALSTDDPLALLEASRKARASGGAMPKGKGKGRSGTAYKPGTDDWEAAIAHGVLAIRAGAASIKNFTDEMVSAFGESIRIHAETLWLEAKQAALRTGGEVSTGPNIVNARGEIQQTPLFDAFGEPVQSVHPGAPLPMHSASGGFNPSPMSGNMYAQPDMFGGEPSLPSGFHFPKPGDDPFTTPLRENGPPQSFPNYDTLGSMDNPGGRNIFTEEPNPIRMRWGDKAVDYLADTIESVAKHMPPAVRDRIYAWAKDWRVDIKVDGAAMESVRMFQKNMQLANPAARINDVLANAANFRVEWVQHQGISTNALKIGKVKIPALELSPRVAMDKVMMMLSKDLRAQGAVEGVWRNRDLAKIMKTGFTDRWGKEMSDAIKYGDTTRQAQLGFTDNPAKKGWSKYIGRATGTTDAAFKDTTREIEKATLRRRNPDLDDFKIAELAEQSAEAMVSMNRGDFFGYDLRYIIAPNKWKPEWGDPHHSLFQNLMGQIERSDFIRGTNAGQATLMFAENMAPFARVIATAAGRGTDYTYGIQKAAMRWVAAKRLGGLNIADRKAINALVSRGAYGIAITVAADKVYENASLKKKIDDWNKWLTHLANIGVNLTRSTASFLTPIDFSDDSKMKVTAIRTDPIVSYDKSSGSIIFNDQGDGPVEGVWNRRLAERMVTDPKVPMTQEQREAAMNFLFMDQFDSPAVGGTRIMSDAGKDVREFAQERGADALARFLPRPVQDIGQPGIEWPKRLVENPVLDFPKRKIDGPLDQLMKATPGKRSELQETGAAHPELAKFGVTLSLDNKFKESDADFKKRNTRTRNEIRAGIESDLNNPAFKSAYEGMSPGEKMVALDVLQNLHKFRYEQTQDMEATFDPGIGSQDESVLNATLKALERVKDTLSLRMHEHEAEKLNAAIHSAEQKLYGKTRKPDKF